MIVGHYKIFRDPEIGRFHPLSSGEKVTVFHLEIPKRPLIEGRAEIIAPVHRASHLYRVRFEGESRQFVRFVHPGDWQQSPTEVLGALLGYWRATVAPDLLINMERDRR